MWFPNTVNTTLNFALLFNNVAIYAKIVGNK